MTAMEAMQRRISVRTYEDRPVDADVRRELEQYIAAQTMGPFGRSVRLTLLDASHDSAAQLRQYGVYGMIKGAKLFLAGAVERGEGAMEDYGYCVESAILRATELGLGTVWLGGTFSRGTFAQKLALRDSEALPAITPVGYAAEKVSLRDNLVRAVAGSRKRKPFGELFLDGAAGMPLSEQVAGPYAQVLQAVRMGPSASNKQPWRVIRGADAFHLCLQEDKAYNHIIPGVLLQNLDMGIAMRHFELAAQELGLASQWRFEKPDIHLGSLIYIASYTRVK